MLPDQRRGPASRGNAPDALFLVGVESDNTQLLHQLHTALTEPRWPLYFGRKAFGPARPLPSAGLAGEHHPVTSRSLDDALRTHPWLGTSAAGTPT
ncbi:type I-E CRISPR-associated protein Cas5/CasD [Streptomyces pharetrae]|uniref:type I-E CRISPR-associated protein Cas5/CasD n=1 Tax=Streptomyces pharetrae TaxID=291370 RepID=UPI003347DD46